MRTQCDEFCLKDWTFLFAQLVYIVSVHKCIAVSFHCAFNFQLPLVSPPAKLSMKWQLCFCDSIRQAAVLCHTTFGTS